VTPSKNCAAFRRILQDRLDGSGEPLPAALEAHRDACPACDADFRAAEIFLQGWHPGKMAALPNEKIDRLVQAVVSDRLVGFQDRRATYRQLLPLLAAAACLALAVIIGSRSAPGPSIEPSKPAPVVVASKEQPISIDQSLAEAGSTLAEISRKNKPVLAPDRWLPADAKSAESWLNEPLPDPIEPAAQSLANIRQGAVSGLEPVANTAKRAFALFAREVPTQGN
jgi:hypothetical protein